MTWDDHRDLELRVAAMDWLARRTADGCDALSTDEIADFEFQGVAFRLMDRQLGIRKPKELVAALSIRTVWRRNEQVRPYDDAVGADGFLRYKWRGKDGNHFENRALRHAMNKRAPLIWFWGVGPAQYKPIYPVYLIGEEPDSHQFVVATDGLQSMQPESVIEETLRRYVRAEVMRRLHQPVFRSMVMRAYEYRCSVCALAHAVLLDAAHIVADRHELGGAAVRNGLAMCKIHHAAYDAGILGVTPDLDIQIRSDILVEIDGPLLEHGLKRLHGQRLRALPRSRSEWPNPDLLALHHESFARGA
ncbi:HNH endonuclease [Nakamurella aerolata]|nr:HNH endonuclease [Nakamurella aerolata]